MARRVRNIDQFCAGFAGGGDAISNEALIFQQHLRSRGFRSEIYCEQVSERDSYLVRHYREYRGDPDDILLYHHSFRTGFILQLRALRARRVLVFHNVTPAEFVTPYNRRTAESLSFAREELRRISDCFVDACADSQFNAETLAAWGLRGAVVLPVPVLFPASRSVVLPATLRWLEDGRRNILFVGRIFPNKRHQDLLKAFYFYKKLEPAARLILVGPLHPGVRGYAAELQSTAQELGVGPDVSFTNMVSQDEMHAYYSRAHLFLSMSEHEGFFVPLVESMFFDVPILAYASSVIPETLRGAGVLFREKNFPYVAELMLELTRPGKLRTAVLRKQAERVLEFRPEQSLAILDGVLERLGAAPGGRSPLPSAAGKAP